MYASPSFNSTLLAFIATAAPTTVTVLLWLLSVCYCLQMQLYCYLYMREILQYVRNFDPMATFSTTFAYS